MDEETRQLWVRCAACRQAFPSGIHVDRNSFEGEKFSGGLHDCPFCGYTAAYGKTDYTYDEQ